MDSAESASPAARTNLPLKVRLAVYCSHALSTRGDRMWAFGVGMFLVIIAQVNLRLTAIYGFTSGGAILLFGPLVGDWVDNTPRIKAAQVTLVLQNLSVVASAIAVFCLLHFQEEIATTWPEERLTDVMFAVIITITVLSNLASMGSKIAVERDWVVEICGPDRDMLASMTAKLRLIDQVALILAPVATGQVMTHASVKIGALFIAGWNVCSVFVEYYLLWKVYQLVPALRSKMYKKRCEKQVPPTMPSADEENAVEMTIMVGKRSSVELQGANAEKLQSGDFTGEADDRVKDEDEGNEKGDETSGAGQATVEEPLVDTPPPSGSPAKGETTAPSPSSCGHCVRRMFSSILTLVRGWRTYMKYDVAFAGIGLAMLYMTVLGFDNITTGYAYTQGLTESTIGILMAAGALAGILGTILYPVIRRRIGLERTGLFGLFFEISCLCFCVASVWAPGSPFDPLNWKKTPECHVAFQSAPLTTTSPSGLTLTSDLRLDNSSLAPLARYSVSTYEGNTTTRGDNSTDMTSECIPPPLIPPVSYISIGLLMGGIICARCGLWMADLTITQLFMEAVDAGERGVVSGVQGSLNKLMDMLKFVMVIVAPQPEVFGVLIIISFIFVCGGWLFYALFSRKRRGHILPFHTCRKSATSNGVNGSSVAVAT